MTFEQIQALMQQLNQSNLMEMDLEFDGGHLFLSKNTISSNKAPTTLTTQPVAHTNSQKAQPKDSDRLKATETTTPKDTTQVIKAPLVGIIYLQPAPDQAPYKKVGDPVAVGDVVCVVEAMKMMTEVKSPISGVISDILVSNEEVVEYDQPLLKVQPKTLARKD